MLDVGCGSAPRAEPAWLARSFPNSRFVGRTTLSSERAIEVAREADAAERRASRICIFERPRRGTRSRGAPTAFDLVTAFDAIHDQAHPDVVLAGISRALRGDGTFLMQDIAGSSHVHEDKGNVMAPFLYTVSCLHCMTVSLSADGAGLGAMWGKELATKMLAEAGFGNVTVRELPHDALNYYYVATK